MATAVVWVGDRAVVWVATEVFVGDPAGFGTAVVTSVLEVTQTAVASVVLTFTQTHIHIHKHTHSYRRVGDQGWLGTWVLVTAVVGFTVRISLV